jgi:hypothetical protein
VAMTNASVLTRVATWSSALVVAAAGAAVVFFIWPGGGPTAASRDWTAAWHAEPPVVSTIPGGLLETASLNMAEDFYRSDSKTWWGIYLGNTVSHIQVQAVYRYGVPLTDPAWEIVTRGQTSVVIAPSLRPSVPVAIDTGTLREKTENGWARFDKQIQLAELRRSMSSELDDRAHEPKRVDLARESSRRTVGEFIEEWLLAQGEWEPDVFSTVKVYFVDEVDDRLRSQLRSRR